MIVAKHHGDWSPREREKITKLRNILFPGYNIRWGHGKIKDHAHVHILER